MASTGPYFGKDEVAEIDASVLRLLQLAKTQRTSIASAGRRVSQHLADEIRNGQDRWAEIEARQLKWGEEARRIVLGRVSAEVKAALFLEYGDYIQRDIHALRVYQHIRHNLAKTQARKALAEYLACKLVSLARRRGEPKSLREARQEARRDYYPDGQGVALAPAFVLSQQLARLLFEEERVRASGDWWEIAVYYLAVECPDMDAKALGLAADLPWGNWKSKDGGNPLRHRDGMRAYVQSFFGADHQAKTDGWTRYRTLLKRTVSFLEGLSELRRPQASAGSAAPAVEDEQDWWFLIPLGRLDRLRSALVELAESDLARFKRGGEGLRVCLDGWREKTRALAAHDGGVTSSAWAAGQELRERVAKWRAPMDVSNDALWEMVALLVVVFEPNLSERRLGLDAMGSWSEWDNKSDDAADSLENRKGILEYAMWHEAGDARKTAWLTRLLDAADAAVSELKHRPRVQKLDQALGSESEARDEPEVQETPEEPSAVAAPVETAPAETAIGETPPKILPAPERALVVDTKRQRAQLDGVSYDLTLAQTEVLAALVTADGVWKKGRELRKDGRADKLIGGLPEELRAVIDSKHAGYRLLVPARIAEK